MRQKAEALLRRAVADGSILVADLQGFRQMDYAGVARILKLDPNLGEAVVAVKLQEVDGGTLLAMQPQNFASSLSLTKPEQGKRLEAFLTALKKVSEASSESEQLQEQRCQAASTATEASAAADLATKKKRTENEKAEAAAAPIKPKKASISRGLQAPRVSGLKRPHHVATAADPSEQNALQEERADIRAAKKQKKQRKHKENCKVAIVKNQTHGVRQPRQRSDMPQERHQEAPHIAEKPRMSIRTRVMSWASSVIALKRQFDESVARQLARKSKQLLISTTGFPEGAGVQVELPALVRRLGPVGSTPTTFEWRPQAPEKVTHLICSNGLMRPTVKLYFAMASNSMLLKEDFLKEAKRQKAWPDPMHYQRDDFPSVELRGKSNWLLRGVRISIEGPYNDAGLSKHQLQSLVIAAGGSLADEASAAIRLLADAETLRRRHARGLCAPSKNGQGQLNVFSTQWLLDCIAAWRYLPLEKYALSLSAPPQQICSGDGPSDAFGGEKAPKGRSIDTVPLDKAERVEKGTPQPPSCAGATPSLHQGELTEGPQRATGKRRNYKRLPTVSLEQACADVEAPSANASCGVTHGHEEGRQQVEQTAKQKKATKKQNTKKRKQTLEKETHERDSRKRKKSAAHLINEVEKQSVVQHPLAAAVMNTAESALAGENGKDHLMGSPAFSNSPCSIPGTVRAGVKGSTGSEAVAEDALGPSPAICDYEESEAFQRRSDTLPCDAGSAAEGLPATALAPEAVTDSAGAPRGECPADVPQVGACVDSLESPGEQLEVAGLFEAEEDGDASGYNFDLDQPYSSGPDTTGVIGTKGGPGLTQQELSGGFHVNENVPCNNSSPADSGTPPPFSMKVFYASPSVALALLSVYCVLYPSLHFISRPQAIVPITFAVGYNEFTVHAATRSRGQNSKIVVAMDRLLGSAGTTLQCSVYFASSQSGRSGTSSSIQNRPCIESMLVRCQAPKKSTEHISTQRLTSSFARMH
ncbi:uncharacterized protein LOC34621970 [Cyclospora cayetanensis]|uniref:Uncharacterized protein LOC34621970 n=1 Tax=Cyclospora cayetanensis TaxID=88456 RepID=A0A6P6RQR5_9EIME|nr:uncharacterized protein LOC34621970 [Cyclospora cayetanensis]